jgi:hypothetical protein
VLSILSDNHLKHAQSNTVVVQQEKMDRVGVEPTISAQLAFLGCSRSLYLLYLKVRGIERVPSTQIPPGPFPNQYFSAPPQQCIRTLLPPSSARSLITIRIARLLQSLFNPRCNRRSHDAWKEIIIVQLKILQASISSLF